MNEPKVNPALIPQSQRDRLGAAVLKRCRAAFEDPKIQKEFADWKAKKNLKQGETI